MPQLKASMLHGDPVRTRADVLSNLHSLNNGWQDHTLSQDEQESLLIGLSRVRNWFYAWDGDTLLFGGGKYIGYQNTTPSSFHRGRQFIEYGTQSAIHALDKLSGRPVSKQSAEWQQLVAKLKSLGVNKALKGAMLRPIL